ERVLTVQTEVTVSALLNRMKTDPWGVLGGGTGDRGGIWFREDATKGWRTFVEAFGTRSPSKFCGVTLRPGNEIRSVMRGGGGEASAGDCDPCLSLRILSNDFISQEAAVSEYEYASVRGDR